MPSSDRELFIAGYRNWVATGCQPAAFFKLVKLLKESSFVSRQQAFSFESSVTLPIDIASDLRSGIRISDQQPNRTLVHKPSLVSIKSPNTVFSEPIPKEFFAGSFTAPAGEMQRMSNIKVWTALWQQIVFSEERVVAELSNHAGLNSATTVSSLQTKRLAGLSAFLCEEGASLFSHWLLDLLPKLSVIESAGVSLKQIDHFIINDDSRGFQREALSRLGIPLSKVTIPTAECRFFHLDDCLMVGRVRSSFVSSPWVRQAAMHTYLHQTSSSDAKLRVYLSRSRADRRRIVNEEALTGLLHANGFSTIWAEDLDVATMATLMQSTSVLLALHGAGIANTIFAREGLKVIEIYGNHISPEYGVISSLCGFQHWVLGARDYQGKKPWENGDHLDFHNQNAQDVFVNRDELASALDLIVRN